MKCPNKDCECLLSSDDKFCPGCGTKNVSENSVTCSGCGTALDPKARFCNHCGKKVVNQYESKQVPPRVCTGINEDGSNCGNKLNSSDKFCLQCGTPVEQERLASSTSSGGNIVQKDVNPDIRCPDRRTEDQKGDKPVQNIEQAFDKDLSETGGKASSDTKTNKNASNREQQPTKSDAASSLPVPSDHKSVSQGRNDHQYSEKVLAEVSSPVPCTEDSRQAKGPASVESLPSKNSQDAGTAGKESKDDPAHASSIRGGNAVGACDREPGTGGPFFSQYADSTVVEKEVISMENQKWNNRSSSPDNRDNRAKLDTKDGCSDMDYDDSLRKSVNKNNIGIDSSSAHFPADPGHAANVFSNCPSSVSDSSPKDYKTENTRNKTDEGQMDIENSQDPEKITDQDEADESKTDDTDEENSDNEKTRDDKNENAKDTKKKRRKRKKGKNAAKQKDGKRLATENALKQKDGNGLATGEKADDKTEGLSTPSKEPRSCEEPESSKSQPHSGKKTYAHAASGVTTRSKVNNASKNSLSNNVDKVTVFFHVVVSKLWERMDPTVYQIFLRCRPESLGAFHPQVDKHEMKYIGDADFGYLYEGKVIMDRDLRNKGFHYKYIAKKTSDKNGIKWEIVQRKVINRDQEFVDRWFCIPEHKRGHTGFWHRYDGAAYFPGAVRESIFDRFLALFGSGKAGDIRQDAINCAKVFLPSVTDIYQASLACPSSMQTTMEGHLEKVLQVMSSLRFQMLDKDQHSVDESLVKQVVEDILVKPLAEKLAEQKGMTVTLAVFLLLLMEEYDLLKNVRNIQFLCCYMLIRPDMNNTTCADMDYLASHFPVNMANKSVLARKIVTLIDQSCPYRGHYHASDPSWLSCISLLHFLQGKSVPFQDLEPSSDFKSNEWWGLTGFNGRKDFFKECTKTMEIPSSLLEMFRPAFQVNPLFIRTFVACLELEALLPVLILGIAPVDVMAATLAHHIERRNYLGVQEEKQLDDCVGLMVFKLKDVKSKEQAGMKEVTTNVQILKELHIQLLKNKRIVREETIMTGTYAVLLALDIVASVESRLCQENNMDQEKQSWQEDAKKVTDDTCRWLSRGLILRSGRSQTLGIWDKLLSQVEEELSHPDLKQTLKQLLAEGFEKELSSLLPDQKLEVYLEQYKMAPAFADVLNRLAFESLDAAFAMESKHVMKVQNVRLVSLLSAFIEEKWRGQVKRDEDVLHFVITWIPMVNYFKRFGEVKQRKALSEMAAQNIRRAFECVVQVLDCLKDGSILIETLRLLILNRERFLAIVEAADHNRESIVALMDLRTHELQTYNTTSSYLDGLLEHCKLLIKTDDIAEVLKAVKNLRDRDDAFPLSEICETVPPDSNKNLKTYKPKANPWKLPEEILVILPVFGDRISSYIFKTLFKESAQKTDFSAVEFWRAFHVVWNDVSKEWQNLCQKMTDGSITLAETESVFSMFRAQRGAYRWNEVKCELRKLSTSDSSQWVKERIDQFTCFTTIKEHVKAAAMLLKVKKANCIEGDFADIEKICSLSQDKNVPIRDVDRSVLRLCTRLKDVTPQDIDCLKDFVQPRCLEFVFWLRENMKDGMKELHVFVDLAFISAGEEPWAIGRVNCFHAATIGYAPLIFIEKEKGCLHMLQQCKLVFANVAADSSLPEKLTDSSRFLEWFKGVQRSHGSVEKTSLSQVANINDRGVFRVGRGDKAKLTLTTVIQLKVSEEPATKSEDRREGTPPRRYMYEELLDLQSRLMLVAGQAEKGKENVDRFIMIMESLVRLGKTYVQLCRDGCVLFLDWTVEFLCDVQRPVCCVSEFASQGKLKGHRAPTEDLENFIAGVAGFLEYCHKEWLSYVDKKRKDYPELNIFTVEQLVFLQQQLIKMGSGEVSKHVYPMLSLLKADCSPEDLEQALQEAMDHIDSAQAQPHQRPQQQVHQPSPVDDREKVATFMMEMKNSGFSVGLAKKALQEVGPDDIAEGIAWCIKHEEDDLSDDMDLEGEDEESIPMEEEAGVKMVGERLREWVTRTESITQSAIGWLDNLDRRERGTTLKSLTGNLGSVWRNFLETVSSSGMDFLSLEHLGIILRYLAAKDKRQFKRLLPPNFKPKIPNLILCPKNEVLNAVTYMYMFPEEEGTLLPQPDEVLLCTEHTTFEQVDIFLRRAFFGSQQKVHCLAFADSLDYDVGEKTEKKIKEYTSIAADHEYCLVVVCTTENEYRARIVAALEKFRRPSPTLSTTKLVQKYLRSRFSGLLTKDGITSASAVDPESLCVRVVKSNRSGVGKTLYKQRLTAQLKRCLPRERRPVAITIPLHSRVALTHDIATCLLQHTLDPTTILPRIVHLDISYQVLEGVDHLLYNLLVLGCVTDSQGQVWLRSPMDLYLVETMPLVDQKDAQRGRVLVHQIFDVLPSLSCWSPHDSLSIMRNSSSVLGYSKHDCLFDEQEYSSEMYQRPFRYLSELDTQRQQAPPGPQGDAATQMVNCLAILLKYCGVVNPSWSELTHFVCFLNKQLQDFENSVYCGMATCEDLPGFSQFVLRFLIQMSRDFATRSLKMSEESLAALMPDETENTDIQQYEMRRTWESSPHPYIFFNPDGHSMTFLGFSIEASSGNLVDHQTNQVLEQGIMSRQLYQALNLNRVPLTEDFDVLPREDRLLRLYRVLGLVDDEIFDNNHQIIDPDDTYELTTDNVKKILAIYMRFRCNIPVIVMGETGCGKTRLVKFLCALQTPKQHNINTMVLVKVHGGTTGEDIIRKVREAEKMACKNAATVGHRPVYTVLFFDEANTTEAVGVIKEVMCDGTLDGQQMNLDPSLKMVAACNPYRKHSDELIKRLENAGLGYHVDADKTVDKLGRVPMRRLVYRVQPLPQSMLPLVWDFGQLNTRVEELYIRQMVRRYVRNGELAYLDEAGMNVLCKILMESQEFMRQLADECSFVSLRDVDRALTVASWFLQEANDSRILFDMLDRKLDPCNNAEEEEEVSESADSQDVEVEDEEQEREAMDMTKALVLSLGVCYRACLRSKEAYDDHIICHFQPPFTLPDSQQQFALIIDRCQDVFLDSVRLEDNIARNQALKENVFMMVVCVELRIPLFLVGKPGSSKSLAKTIVSDAMQGNSAYSELFKTLKQAQMVSFQCSPLATADGILGTFRQCAKFQEGKKKESFVSVVVLDEVGLAEDSPKMPLKTLHPLLEDGCPGDEVPDDSKKVAFIGISNWALDPAKMNRGILVQRDVPDEEELTETARGICTTDDKIALQNMNELIPELAKAYLNIFQEAKEKREFFGLRDFYSLVKMVYTFAAKSKQRPSQRQLIAAIRRNFGGLDTIDPVESFKKLLPTSLCEERSRPGDPDCSPSGLIKAALSGDDMGGETRYLLLLTENYGGLSILSENLLADRRVVPIFGSSFPKDQEYTQICRNINRIKVCMETGQTVILLNLENLYESLYDALNQYYATLGGERYVDLGLGTHRVKCRVHRQFRLIVVAEKQAVYDKFPIPLINRLEKHFLTLNNIMSLEQLKLAKQLEDWARDFVSTTPQGPLTRYRARGMKKEEVGDVFMGYHPDTAPAIVLKVWDTLGVSQNPSAKHQVLEECQHMLLWCATPDAVVRSHNKQWSEVYHDQQQHEHLQQYLHQRLQQHVADNTMMMAQVTTHSKLLTEQERVELCQTLPVCDVTLLSLQAFDTEQQFSQQLRLFFSDSRNGHKLLVVQCDSGDSNQNLIKGAQYCMQDLRPENSSQHHVVFVIQLPSIAGACFTGFLGGNWHCLHIDDLRRLDRPVPSITLLQSRTPAQLILATLPTETEQLTVGSSHDLMQLHDGADADTSSAGAQAPMEVDISDVQVEMGSRPSPDGDASASLWEIRQPQGFDPQYVKHLFHCAIQAAVALVRDPEEGTVRATHRITILLRLLEENNQFFVGLHKLVGSILKEKEQQAYQAECWLSKEAARLEEVKKAGTFRRAWMQFMENKVVPVLAGVIAYLDTNHNLDLLVNPGREWVEQVWLSILQEVCQLNYKHLRSVSDKDELEEFTVHHTGAGPHPFSAHLPFSWLLWKFIENAITGAKSVEGDLLDTAGGVVDQSPFGRCLHKVTVENEDKLMHMFQLYISDLLCFTFPLSPRHHKLLCVCVEKGLEQLHINLVQLEVGRGLVALHMLVDQMRPRLQAILDMASARPSAIGALHAGGAGGPCAHLLATLGEMTEDVAVLRLLVEELQPRPSQLDNEAGCQEWVTHYTTVAPVILRILNDSDSVLISQHGGAEGNRIEGEEEEDVVVKVNSLPYGDRCKQQLVAVRCLWTRVTTLKLFLDFVGPLRQGHHKLSKALETVKLELLCKLLDEGVDMKQATGLAQVDKFLKHANGRMMQGLLGKLGKCTYCDVKFESAPVELPCKHRLCNSCYRDCCHGNIENAQCPECEAPIPGDFDPVSAYNQNKEAVELLGRYQRQVSGFLMALVSQLCFAGKTPPQADAVKHIFGYIIHRSKGKTLLQTKNMTVHDDLIDPTPVLRSFLLRLLLKHSENEVYNHLDEFLRSAETMITQELAASSETAGSPTLLEFSLLIIHCIEDLHHEHDAVISADLKQEEHQLYVADLLHEVTDSLRDPPRLLSLLYSLGRLRYALDVCAHILHSTFVAANSSPVVSDELENLLFELQRACQTETTDWPKRFLVKQLCHEYGIQDFIKLVKRAKQLQLLDWIAIQEPTNQVEAVADRYLVCGEHYKHVRDLLEQLKLFGDSAQLLQVLQDLQLVAEQKETLLLLALHREVAMSILHPMPDQVRTVMADHVRQLVHDCDILQDKVLAQKLCDNQLGEVGTMLHIHPDQDLGMQSVLCLLTHLSLVLRPGTTPGSRLLNPLTALAFQPASMANAFLPTMPQDNLQEVLAAMPENVTVWKCPQGHRYFIADCGKPGSEGVCSCGRRIGGVNHVAAPQNVLTTRDDTTQTGHILGSAAQRGLESVPERHLSAVECAVLRFLTHAMLYLAASTASLAAQVSQMVAPRITPDQAAQYFLDHVMCDLQVLQRALGRSADDVFLVLHHICHLLAWKQAGGDASHLQTKDQRAQWERQFTSVFIAPAIQNLDNVVRSGNQAIVSDTRRGNSALLKVVYEDELTGSGNHDVQQLFLNPAVWRYRPPITVNHFFRQFHLEVEACQDMKNAFPVLRLFKAQRHIVQALHFVPAILMGQRRLMMQLHRRLDRAEAATLTIEEVITRHERSSLEQLLINFSKAWEIIKEHLIGFQCVAPVEGVMLSLPEEFYNITITKESPVALLLPSMYGPGLCSYIFMQYIFGQNNDFLKTYCGILKQQYNSLPEVNVRAITERHLVGCSLERDLLPMVLSHSNYSLMVGQAATLEYDFEAFQQQLEDTLLQCRARVQRSPLGHFTVETMVYRADTTNSRLFRAVREKIEQECLSPAERRQIVEDLRELPDICLSIDNLNTALSFLKALGGTPSASLHEFMTNALKMRRSVLSRKAQQLCQLTHVQSLWIVLCHQRATILAAHHQDAFDSVGKELREELTPEQGKELEAMCHQMSVERLELVLLQLFECIMLYLSEPHSQDDVTRPENYKLHDVLVMNLDSPLYNTEPVEVRSGLLTPRDLDSFPESLQGRHATTTWMVCRAILAAKRLMLL